MGRRHSPRSTRQRQTRLGEAARELLPNYQDYKSDLELMIALDAQKRGIKLEYEPIRLPYVIEHNYTPDWRIPGTNIIIEAKGYFTTEERAKMLAVKEAHPDLDIRLIFQDGGKRLSKTSNTTYGMWATKHGFTWAQGPIPFQWVAQLEQ
jgi:hypothetical protein